MSLRYTRLLRLDCKQFVIGSLVGPFCQRYLTSISFEMFEKWICLVVMFCRCCVWCHLTIALSCSAIRYPSFDQFHLKEQKSHHKSWKVTTERTRARCVLPSVCALFCSIVFDWCRFTFRLVRLRRLRLIPFCRRTDVSDRFVSLNRRILPVFLFLFVSIFCCFHRRCMIISLDRLFFLLDSPYLNSMLAALPYRLYLALWSVYW